MGEEGAMAPAAPVADATEPPKSEIKSPLGATPNVSALEPEVIFPFVHVNPEALDAVALPPSVDEETEKLNCPPEREEVAVP